MGVCSGCSAAQHVEGRHGSNGADSPWQKTTEIVTSHRQVCGQLKTLPFGVHFCPRTDWQGITSKTGWHGNSLPDNFCCLTNPRLPEAELRNSLLPRGVRQQKTPASPQPNLETQFCPKSVPTTERPRRPEAVIGRFISVFFF